MFIAMGVAMVLSGCHSRPSSEGSAAALPPSTGYLRSVRPPDGKAQLQIAVRRFTPRHQPATGTPVWLVGVSHIGDARYYDALQKLLEAQAVVLYEGVKVAEQPSRSIPTPTAEERQEALEASLQGKMAEALGLVFQLTAIHYNRPSFRNSDISLTELEKLVASQMKGSGETTEQNAAGAEFEMLKQALEGGSWLNQLASILFGLIQSSPRLQGLAKLALIEITGAAGDNLESLSQMSPGMKTLLKVLVESRNQKVMQDLRVTLRQASSRGGVAIFYGAAHMRDFESRLRGIGYLPREERWLTAVELDLQSAGIGPMEEKLLRSLVDWEQLK